MLRISGLTHHREGKSLAYRRLCRRRVSLIVAGFLASISLLPHVASAQVRKIDMYLGGYLCGN
jgi:hypothetical protein